MEVSSKIKVVFAGSPHVSAKILENLILNKDFDLKLVISQPPKRKKRGALIEDTEVTRVAKKNNVSVINPERVDHEVKKILDEIEFDILLVTAYGMMLPKWMLDMPNSAAVNIHFSLLPKLRGASPIHSAILENQEITGLSYMQITEGLDQGPIYKSFTHRIGNQDRQELECNLLNLALENTPKVLKQIFYKEIEGIRQNQEDATYCHKIKKESGLVDVTKDPFDEIFNKFKAFIGWPGIFFIFKEKRIKIIKMHLDKSENKELLKEKLNDVFHVTTNGLICFQGDKAIVITHLQFENKNIIGPKDIYNSYRNFFQ